MHPFASLIGLVVDEQRAGFSRCTLVIAEHHLNPHRVVHGAVVCALADTGMGAALYPTLAEGESCATIDVQISYFRPAAAGLLVCLSEIVNRGRTIANLESRVLLGDSLIAKASGNFSIFKPRATA